MSDITFKNKLPDDMTIEEKEQLIEYKKAGCPDLVSLTESEIFKWFNMFMGGKTYGEIASFCKVKKDRILYMAEKSKWLEKRMNHYKDIIDNASEKIKSTKLDSVNTVASAISALNKYYNDQFTEFLATNNKDVISNIDVKLLAQYYRSVELLDKMLQNSVPGAKKSEEVKPTVNVNIENATIEQTDDGLDITSEESATGPSPADLLKFLAKYKKKNG